MTDAEINNFTEIKQIYVDAQNDPSLFSTIDINALLDKIESVETSYLDNKTVADISKDIYDAIVDVGDSFGINEDTARSYCEKLSGYRYIDRVCDLRQGNHIKWIWKKNNIMTRGSRLFTVTMGDNGTILTCKNYGGTFVKINFDLVVLFQKLTMEEQLILMAYEYLEKNEDK